MLRKGFYTSTLILFLVYIGTTLFMYNRMVALPATCGDADNTPAGFAIDPFTTQLNLSDYRMPDYETVSFPGGDEGITLSGWYIPTESDAAVIIVHSYNACKRSPTVLLAAGMLHRAGLNVLVFDLRDRGDSTFEDGRWSGGVKEYRDVLSAWHWIQDEKGISAEHTGLMGFSGGTAAVLFALDAEPRIAAAWLDSVYTDLQQIVIEGLQIGDIDIPPMVMSGAMNVIKVFYGDDLTALRPMDGKINNRPIFITHGSADPVLQVKHAYALADTFDVPDDSFWIVPGSRHLHAIFDASQEYENRLTAFFSENLNHMANPKIRAELEQKIIERSWEVEISRYQATWIDSPQFQAYLASWETLQQYYVENPDDTAIGIEALGEYFQFKQILRLFC